MPRSSRRVGGERPAPHSSIVQVLERGEHRRAHWRRGQVFIEHFPTSAKRLVDRNESIRGSCLRLCILNVQLIVLPFRIEHVE